MNCRSCNTIINYNYVTDCPQCGCAVEGGNLPKLDPAIELAQKKSIWPNCVVNVGYVLSASFVGMISGAVVLYFSTAVLYMALASPETYPGEHCGRGMAFGMLSILTGGFLGIAGGTAFSVKHPIIK